MHWLRSQLDMVNKDGPNWYGDFLELNGLSYFPFNKELFMTLQKQSIKDNNLHLQTEIDILNSKINDINKQFKDDKGYSDEQDFFSAFLKQINKGYELIPKNAEKPNASEIVNYQNNLIKFIQKLSKYMGTQVPISIEKEMIQLVEDINNKNFNSFKQNKALMWEHIAIWVLSRAGFSSYGVGQIVDSYGKQLVQDGVSYLVTEKMPSAPPGGEFISVRITGRTSNQKTSQLKQELEKQLKDNVNGTSYEIQMENKKYIKINISQLSIPEIHNLLINTSSSLNRNITIKVNNNIKNILQNFFTVQAKSGNNQDLLNNTKRDLINKKHLAEWDHYLSLLIHFFYTKSNKSKDIPSEGLDAYVNYVFSKNIAKTTLGKNTIFLSHYGFNTLDSYMDNNNFYFRLSPSPNTLRRLSTESFKIYENHV